jgi:16S rRNA (cytidine1402-2'-O)-methyltransferase
MAGMRKRTINKSSTPTENSGSLFVVATPIGNLEDITLRALRVLKEVDLIAAEDTRHTRKLLTHFAISTPTFSYYKEKEQSRSDKIIEKLLAGQHVALVSDAGTPGISDPGSILVQKCTAEQIEVVPIPGPSSLTTALSVAGIAEGSFVFLGFAPARQKQRQNVLQELVSEKKHLVFFEAPHRIGKFINDCLEILGDRQVFWCRELTKMHEELTHSTLRTLSVSATEKKIKGESVFIISGSPDKPPLSKEEIEEILRQYKLTGEISLKDAVKDVTNVYNLSRSKVYNLALKIWQ